MDLASAPEVSECISPESTFEVRISAIHSTGQMFMLTNGSDTWGPFNSGVEAILEFSADGITTTGMITAHPQDNPGCLLEIGDFGPVEPCALPIPSLSQWGTLILILLLSIIGILVLKANFRLKETN